MNKSDTRFTVWGSTELLLLEFECAALEISQKLPYLTKLPQNYLPALLDCPSPEAPTLRLHLERICSTAEIMLTNTTPHLCNYRPEKVLWGNKYSFMLDEKYRSDLLLQLQVIKLALLHFSINLPDLFIRMSLFSGETLPALSCPSPPPSPQNLSKLLFDQGIRGFLFFWSSLWGHKLQCGVLWKCPRLLHG